MGCEAIMSDRSSENELGIKENKAFYLLTPP
jgi:hypothetical protein